MFCLPGCCWESSLALGLPSGECVSPQLLPCLSLTSVQAGRGLGCTSSFLLLGSLGEKSFQRLVTASKGRPWWFGPVQGFALDYFSSSSQYICLDPSLLLIILLSFLLNFSAGFSALFLWEADSIESIIDDGRQSTSFCYEVQEKPSSKIPQDSCWTCDDWTPRRLSFPLWRIGLGFPCPAFHDF